MGGSRVKKTRMYFNIFVVWMVTGFWHGAAWNFIIWGLMFGILLLIEKGFLLKYLNKSKVWSRCYLLLMVVISFVIFNAVDMAEAFRYIGGMFGGGGIPLVSPEALFHLRNYAVIFVLAIIGATPLPKLAVSKCKAVQYLEPLVLLALLAVCTAYLVDGSFNPFLYFRF
jgi:alginate O-acetyltransferase complex protein AlgI